jgi:3-dehydroquinate synthase
MNYGHSLGHALEALTDNAIPHGTAVVLGMLIENEISVSEGRLSPAMASELGNTARLLIGQRFIDCLRSVNLDRISDVLAKDKKSEGKELKLALLHEPGVIRFHSFLLDDGAREKVVAAVSNVLDRLSARPA